MPQRTFKYWLAMVFIMGFLPMGACNCNNSSQTASTKDQSKQAKALGPHAAAKTKKAKVKAPSVTLYPDFNFGLLKPKQRIKFVSIASAELCPCPNSAISLNECLQSRKKRCGMAEQVAGIIAIGLQEGYNRSDILDKVGKFVESSKKHYTFTLKNVPHIGPVNAPVQVVEFADFQCPHCKAADPVMKKLVKKYGKKIVYYFKNFPLNGHPEARLAARSALAAYQQGKFWQMHDLLFKYQESLDRNRVIQFAQQLGLNLPKFKKDLDSAEIKNRVNRDKKEGEDAEITGTPTVFINGRKFMDEAAVPQLSKAIDAALNSKGAK